jgi:hypothetical protein
MVMLFAPDHIVSGIPVSGTTLLLQGIPTAIRPARTTAVPCLVTTGGNLVYPGIIEIFTNGEAQMYFDDPGLSGQEYFYSLWPNNQAIGFRTFNSSGQALNYSVN